MSSQVWLARPLRLRLFLVYQLQHEDIIHPIEIDALGVPGRPTERTTSRYTDRYIYFLSKLIHVISDGPSINTFSNLGSRHLICEKEKTSEVNQLHWRSTPYLWENTIRSHDLILTHFSPNVTVAIPYYHPLPKSIVAYASMPYILVLVHLQYFHSLPPHPGPPYSYLGTRTVVHWYCTTKTTGLYSGMTSMTGTDVGLRLPRYAMQI